MPATRAFSANPTTWPSTVPTRFRPLSGRSPPLSHRRPTPGASPRISPSPSLRPLSFASSEPRKRLPEWSSYCSSHADTPASDMTTYTWAPTATYLRRTHPIRIGKSCAPRRGGFLGVPSARFLASPLILTMRCRALSAAPLAGGGQGNSLPCRVHILRATEPPETSIWSWPCLSLLLERARRLLLIAPRHRTRAWPCPGTPLGPRRQPASPALLLAPQPRPVRPSSRRRRPEPAHAW